MKSRLLASPHWAAAELFAGLAHSAGLENHMKSRLVASPHWAAAELFRELVQSARIERYLTPKKPR